MTAMVAGISTDSVEREAAMMEASSNFIWARKIRALRAALDKAEAERDRLREALTEWDALIEHQYSGSREAMSAMTSVAQKTAKLLKGETP